MAINEIIKQIDAYLALLLQARGLLSSSVKTDSVAGVTGKKRRNPTNSKDLAIPRGRQIVKAESLTGTTITCRVSTKRAATSFQPHVLVIKSSDPEPTASMSVDNTPPTRVAVKRLPARHRSNPNRIAAHQPVKLGKEGSIKAATALSNVSNSKIVVISAEQARSERERLAKPAAVQHRSPGSGSSGRLAFEAIFGR